MTTAKAVEVTRATRDGHQLSDDQIRWFIESYMTGRVAEEQAAALLMAVVWRGMTGRRVGRLDRCHDRVGAAAGSVDR